MKHTVMYHTKDEKGKLITCSEEFECTKPLGQTGPFMVFHQEDTEVYINMQDIIRLERPVSKIAVPNQQLIGGQ